MSAINCCTSHTGALSTQLTEQSALGETSKAAGAIDAPTPDPASLASTVNGKAGRAEGVDDSMLARIRAAITQALHSPQSGGSGFSWFAQFQSAIQSAVQSANASAGTSPPHPLPIPQPPTPFPGPETGTPDLKPIVKATQTETAPSLAAAPEAPISAPVPTVRTQTAESIQLAPERIASSAVETATPAVSADSAQLLPVPTPRSRVVATRTAHSAAEKITTNLHQNQPLIGGGSSVTIASLIRGLFVDASA